MKLLVQVHPKNDGDMQTQAAAVMLKALMQSLIMVGLMILYPNFSFGLCLIGDVGGNKRVTLPFLPCSFCL